MEVKREHFRAMIFYDFKSGLDQQESFQRLHAAFPNIAPSRATVYRWFGEFRRGRESLEDEERSGRPQTAVTHENVIRVEAMVRDDPRVTYHDIERTLGIASPQVSEILHQQLRLRRLCSRWVPHSLSDAQKATRVEWCHEMIARFDNGTSNSALDIMTGDESWIYQYDPETKRQSTVWVFPGDDPPVKVKRARSVGRKMVATFFSGRGHIATIPLEDRRTVTAEWYTTVCLPRVFQVIHERRPKTGLRGMFLHHDNASAHTAMRTVEFLQQSGVKLVDHPPYSPDLAPCDFELFPKVKEQLRGRRFGSAEEAVAAYREHLERISKDTWRKTINTWFRRMQLCIDASGEYFEQM